LLVALIVLGALAVGVDRLAAYVASTVVAERLAQTESLSQRPTVVVHGFPFLTQAANGVYDDVSITAREVRRAQVTVSLVRARLRGIHLPPSLLLHQQVRQLPIDEVSGTVSVTYADLAAAFPADVVSLSDDGGRLRVTGRVSVLGQQVAATGEAAVQLHGDTVDVVVGHVAVSSPVAASIPDSLLTSLASDLSFQANVGRLPFGLRLTNVAVQPNGLAVSASARGVVLNTAAT
jgi:hypothetical protein